MFCRNCGAQIDHDGPFCGVCGTKGEVNITALPKSRRRIAWTFLIGGIVVFFIVLAWHSTSGNGSSTSETSATETPATETPSVAHKINKTVDVGVWSYLVTGMRWENSIGSDFTRERPDAKFLLIDVTIRNNDRTSSTLGPLKLVDGEHREYDESSKGAFIEGSFGLLKAVNPGVTSSGTVVFDVPPGHYSLLVPGGFGSGKTATIDLE